MEFVVLNILGIIISIFIITVLKKNRNESKYKHDIEYNIDMKEVSKHNKISSGVWIVINNNVYDITLFIKKNRHFSTKVIEPYYGKDATCTFNGVVHSKYAKKLLTKFKIGQLLKNNKIQKQNQAIKTKRMVSTINLYNIRVSKILIYPIKGCQCISVNRAYISYDGLKNDRIYAFCNKKTGKVINQLRFPKLSQIKIDFIDKNEKHFDNGILINDMIIPLINNKESELFVKWKSCKTPIKVYNQGEEISKWITNYINNKKQYILVRISKTNYREASSHYKVDSVKNNIGGFQNYCAVSVTSEQSLNELNKRLEQKKLLPFTWLSVGFRMSIIIDGFQMTQKKKVPSNYTCFKCKMVGDHWIMHCRRINFEPYYEDFMKEIVFINAKKESKAAEIVFSKRRYACAVPQVNQITSEITSEPMDTLSTYRSALHLNDFTAPPGDSAVFFGSLYAVKQCGVIYVGQKIK